mgnify:CR=1 FL=1
MKKNRLFAFALVLVLAASAMLAGCAASGKPAESTEAAGDQLARIQAKGEIIVAMEGTWAPWTYHDESDQLVGYDVEVAKAVAEKLGVTASFVEGEWDGLLAGLDAGRYDIMVKGKSTANTISSTYATQAEAYGATVTGVDDLNQTIELLLAGRIDATLNTEVVFEDYKKAHPDADIKIAAYSDEVENIAIPVRKDGDSATLLAAINQALVELDADGTLAALSNKYFGKDISR